MYGVELLYESVANTIDAGFASAITYDAVDGIVALMEDNYPLLDSALTSYVADRSPSLVPPVTTYELKFYREGANSFTLKNRVGAELAEVTSAYHGLKLTTTNDFGTQPVMDQHWTMFDNDLLRGTIRSIEGRAQQKLELNAGATVADYNNVHVDANLVGGATGYNAISPSQTHVYGPRAGESPALDFSLANSIVYYVDPMRFNGTLNPINGLPGGQYEVVLKLANPCPEMSTYYKFPQTDIKGFIGPLLIVANAGTRSIAVSTIFGGYISHSTIGGDPRQLVVTETGNEDICFISTNNTGQIDWLGANAYGTRIFQDSFSWNAAQTFFLSPQINSDGGPFSGDGGYMWWNETNNMLCAVAPRGAEMWFIDCATGSPQEIAHNAALMPGNLVSAVGSQLTDQLFTLIQGPSSLKLYSTDVTSRTVLTSVTLTLTDTILHVNQMVVDDANLKLYVSFQTSAGIEIRVFDYSTTLTQVDSTIALTTATSVAPCVPAIRVGDLYIPHETLIFKFDKINLAQTAILAPAVKVHRLEHDPQRNFLIGTSNYQQRTEFLGNSTGALSIWMGDVTFQFQNKNITWLRPVRFTRLQDTSTPKLI